jgi:hypothetical protein
MRCAERRSRRRFSVVYVEGDVGDGRAREDIQDGRPGRLLRHREDHRQGQLRRRQAGQAPHHQDRGESGTATRAASWTALPRTRFSRGRGKIRRRRC